MKHQHSNVLIALAGQPNCGKSTIFNLLTGARQHVANFPGVTVEKKQGRYKDGDRRIEVVDLPGTYSLTSYTQEERVARDFLLLERPEVVVTVVDAANLERHLYLVFQLREMRVPMVLCVNMIDVADRRGITIKADALSDALGIPVVLTNGKNGRGAEDLRSAIRTVADRHEHTPGGWRLDYGEVLEPVLAGLAERLEARPHLMEDFPSRWLAVKLLENDGEARRIVQHHTHDGKGDELIRYADERRRILREEQNTTPEKVIATIRYKQASSIVESCTDRPARPDRTFTDKIDTLVLHRYGGPLILAFVLFAFYQIAMVMGTEASNMAFPYIKMIKEATQSVLETSDPIRPDLFESMMVDGLVGGIVAILYYVPMFFILFGLLAILEDSGYMARVAFILDRLFRWFGLHGQSTLPMILGGVVVGGCCVPGVLATRAMKDEKARLVTILIMPLMNCLAKIPFYLMMVGLMVKAGGWIVFSGFEPRGPEWLQWLMKPLYWGKAESGLGGRWLHLEVSYQGMALFGLSVFTFVAALITAKLFSRTVARGKPAPFVMELPVYHLPTFGGVLRRAIERVWLFLKKIMTIVAVVQVVVWFFVTFPGIGVDQEAEYDRMHAEARTAMVTRAGQGNPYRSLMEDRTILQINRLRDKVKQAKSVLPTDPEAVTEQELNERKTLCAAHMAELKATNRPEHFLLANGGEDLDGTRDKMAKAAAKALKKYNRETKSLRMARKSEQVNDSFAGQVGQSLEPVSKLAGFEWRMNIAIIASFAAKENLLGTLGTIYSAEEQDAGTLAESVAKSEPKWTLWHKLAILLFVAFFPPCLATIIVIKSETASWNWALFASIYPIVFGFAIAVFVFQIGPLLYAG